MSSPLKNRISASYCEAILSVAHEPILLIDNSLKVIAANKPFCIQFHLPIDFIKGKKLSEIGFDSKKLTVAFRKIITDNTNIENLKFYYEIEGLKRKFLLNINFINDSGTFMLAFREYMDTQKNFTKELKKKVALQTEEVKQSKSMLRSILNSTNQGIAIYEALRNESGKIHDFRISYTNPEVPRNFGLNPEDVSGKACREVYPGIFENGVFEKMATCMRTGIPESYEIAVTHDGKEMWLSATMEKVNNSVTITSRNITQEKIAALEIEEMNILLSNKNRELEQMLLTEFSESFYSFETGKPFFNSLLLEIASKTKMDFVILGEVLPGEEGGEIIKCLSAVVHGKIIDDFKYQLTDGPCAEVLSGQQYSYPKDCQKLFPTNLTLKEFNAEGYIGHPLKDATGKTIGLISVLNQTEIRDVAYIESLLKIAAKRSQMEFERLQNEKLLAQKNAELEKQNMELASFAYISSHDLQEPLRKIQMFSSRILEKEYDNFSESSLSYFQSIIRAASRMQNLIESLLNYSKMDSKKIKFEFLDLNVALEEIKSNLLELIESKNVKIEVEELPTLKVIPWQFQQLLTNLINNGIKYSKKDVSPIITINAETVDYEGDKFWKINVADNGIGFPQEYEEKIFQLFKRLHSKNDYEGTGIGLAICKKIAEKHGGFLKAVGNPDRGSTFSLYIPYR